MNLSNTCSFCYSIGKFEILHDDFPGSGRDRAGVEDVYLPLEDREQKDGGEKDRHMVDGLGQVERSQGRDLEAAGAVRVGGKGSGLPCTAI